MKKFSIISVLIIFVAVMVMMVGCHIDPPTPEPVDESISVMSFNVRIDAVVGTQKTDYDSVSARSELMLKHIADADPDILCMQEWTITHEGTIWKTLRETYSKVGEKRELALNAESNVILFKTERFELVETKTFWLSDTPDVESEKDPETGLYPWGSEYPRICTTAVLRDVISGKTFRVSNTHLDITPEAAGKQRKMLVDFTANSAEPAILCGDFNFNALSPLYLYCINTLNDCRTADLNSTTTASYNGYNLFENTQDQVLDKDGNVKDGYGYPIDQIFVKRNSFTIHSYDVLNYLIDGKFSSDHFPLLVRLSVNDVETDAE